MSGSQTVPATRRPRRKKALRIGGIILLLCVLLYLSTPWLVPDKWIAATLSSRMQRLMNRPVQIESVVFDYSRGLTIKGFRIGRREGFGNGALVDAEELSIPLSRHALARPAKLLSHLLGVSTAPFERIEIRQPQCWAVVNEQGALNIADLNDRGNARLLARSFDITGLTLNFIDLRPSAVESGSDHQQIVLPTLKCSLTPSTGHVNVEGGPEAADADAGGAATSGVAVSGDITTPRLGADAPLGGGGTIKWRDLDLRQVPRLLIPFEGVQALRGFSDGALEVQISEDLNITFAADVELHRPMALLSDGRSWPLFEQSSLSIAGRWDPQAEYVEFSKLKYDAPQAISLTGRGSLAVVIDPHSERRVVVALSGRAESLDVLRKQLAVPLAALGIAGMEDLRADGPCEFEFDYARTPHGERYDVRLDATASRIVLDGRLSMPSGETKRVALTLNHGAGRWHWQRCDATIGRSTLEVTGDWLADSSEPPSDASSDASSLDRLLDRLRTSSLQLTFETADFAELFDRAPVLSEWLPHVDVKGPGSLRLEFVPRSEGARFAGHLKLGTDAALNVGRVIAKKPGMPLSVDYSGVWSAASAGRLEDVKIDLQFGPARMVTTSEGANFAIAAELPQSEWDREKLLRGTLEASMSASVEFVAVEHFVSLFPGLAERLRMLDETGAANQRAMPVLSGDCRIGVSANLASIHGKPVARVHLRAEGNELAIRAGDVFRLRRGDAARFELDYRYDARRPQASEMFGLIAELPGGRLEVVSERQQTADEDNSEPEHDLSVNLKYDNLPRFASHFPAIRRQLRSYGLGGAGRLKLEASGRGDTQSWHVHADLTETDLAPTADGWRKPAGAPLTLALDGRLEGESPGKASARLVLDSVKCRLGASTLEMSGFAADFDNLSVPARLPSGSGISPASPPILRRLRGSAHGDLAFEGPGRAQAFNTHLGDWLERYGTSGELTFDWDLSYDGVRWTLTGLANATDLAFAAPPQAAKPAGLPAEFEVDASIVPARSGASSTMLKLRLCEVRVGEMSASVNGTLVAHSARKLLADTEAADLVVTFDAPDLAQLAQVWPGLSGAELGGRLRLAAALAADNAGWSAPNGGWSVDSAMLDLDEVCVSAGDSSLSANGIVRYDLGRWRSDSLELQTPFGRALLTGDGCLTDSEEPFWLTVRFGEVDGDEVTADVRAIIGDAATLWSRATDHPITQADLEEMLLGDSQFGALHADVTLQFEGLHWFDSNRRALHHFDEVVCKLACRQGDCEWDVRGGYEGGLLQAQFQGKPSDPELQVVLTEALSTEHIQMLLRTAYPGLEPSGTVDCSRIPGVPPQLWSAEEGQAIAYGEIIVRGGVLRGKATPGWVTTVFPSLDLAAFNFSLMHDWFAEYADGRIQHHAVFQGQYYNLYASGWENNDATVVYQIGIDLLGGLESAYWATSGSGRIPLFDSVTLLGDDGQVLEETVNYVPLDFVKAILWGANPIHTAYMALRKRILEEK